MNDEFEGWEDAALAASEPFVKETHTLTLQEKYLDFIGDIYKWKQNYTGFSRNLGEYRITIILTGAGNWTFMLTKHEESIEPSHPFPIIGIAMLFAFCRWQKELGIEIDKKWAQQKQEALIELDKMNEEKYGSRS